MPRLKWDDKYFIGIEQFDKDHKHLVALLDEIFDVLVSNRHNVTRSQEMLYSLTMYTITHFTNEEIWMRNCNYPRMEEHVRGHQGFTQRLAGFEQNFHGGTGIFALDIITFLKVWLLTHIAITDAGLGEFSREETNQAKVIGL